LRDLVKDGNLGRLAAQRANAEDLAVQKSGTALSRSIAMFQKLVVSARAPDSSTPRSKQAQYEARIQELEARSKAAEAASRDLRKRNKELEQRNLELEERCGDVDQITGEVLALQKLAERMRIK